MDDALFDCAGLRLSRLWLCFGSERDRTDAATIHALLGVAQTNVLPVNTHRLATVNSWDALELGYGGVPYRDFACRHDVSAMTLMININHARSAEEAVNRAQRAFRLSGEHVIKLEVLNDDLVTSNQQEVVPAARALLAWNRDLLVLPLIRGELDIAKQLIEAGCPLLRVMGSPIGSRRGIDDPAGLERICNLGTPVILDGGVGGDEHVRQAFDLGVSGVLVNSMLYGTPLSPVDVLWCFVQKTRPIMTSSFAPDGRTSAPPAGALSLL